MSPATAPESANPDALVYGDPHLHTDAAVLALAFAADGNLWSVEEPGVVRRWNAATGSQLACHSLSDLETVWAFGQDARLLASAGTDLSVWLPASGRLLTVIPQKTWVDALAFDPACRLLAAGHDDGAVRVWEVTNRKLLHELALHKEGISALAFSADGTRLATAGEERRIGVWDLASGKLLGTLEGHTDRIPALAWHPDGVHLVSAGWDTTARVWDARKLAPVILLNSHAAQVTALAFARDGGLLACGDSANAVHVWRFADKKTLHVLRDPHTPVAYLAFSPDGKRLASAGEGRVIRLWDPALGQALSGSAAPSVSRVSLSLSPDGKRLAGNGGGTSVRVWDAWSPAAVQELRDDEVTHSLAWSPDGRFLACGTDVGVRLRDAETGLPAALLEGPEEPVTALAFSPDGKTLASAGATSLSVWLWRVADGEPVLLIPDALDGCVVEALAFHPNGRHLAAAGIDWLATGGSTGAVSVWDIEDRCEVATFGGGAVAVAFDPSGDRLAAASTEQTIFVWDLKTQQLALELAGHEEAVTCLAYSPDGRWLASGGDDWTVRLWDLAAGQQRASRQLDTQVKAVCFSPDGRSLFTANGNTTCYRLDVARLLS